MQHKPVYQQATILCRCIWDADGSGPTEYKEYDYGYTWLSPLYIYFAILLNITRLPITLYSLSIYSLLSSQNYKRQCVQWYYGKHVDSKSD